MLARKTLFSGKRTVSTQNRTGTRVIGIIGAGCHTGVTHTAVMMSVFLGAVAGMQTALSEYNDSGCFRQARIILKNNFRNKYASVTKIISFYGSGERDIADIISAGYDYVVIDFGNDWDKAASQFLMCSTKIVVGSTTWWKIHEFVGFLVDTEKERSRKNWIFLSPFSIKEGIKYLRKEFKINVHTVPFLADPTCLDENSLDFFHSIIPGIF